MVMSAQMNGHSTAVVKAQLSSRHTFSGKNNRTEITSPSQPANRTPAPESALPFNGRFLKRSAFWKPSATLPVFWRPWPPFPVSFPARTFRRKPSPEPMPVFFSFSFYLYYSFCSSACGGLGIIPPPSGEHFLHTVPGKFSP